MAKTKPQTVGRRFVAVSEAARNALSKAKRNRHSLSGSGYYARDYLQRVASVQDEGRRICALLEARNQKEHAELLTAALDSLSSGTDSFNEAATKLNRLRTVWYSTVLPRAEGTGIGVSGQPYYLPPEMRHLLPHLLGHVFDQVQGCFSFQFWDAQLVMLRKLTESLIIAAYEKAGRPNEITNNGNYLPFGELCGKAKSGSPLVLSRDSKNALDSVKQLGDNAAHNPRFVAKRSDMEKIQNGSRILIEDLAQNIRNFEVSRPRLLLP